MIRTSVLTFLILSCPALPQSVINDVTQLNPIPVRQVIAPTSVEQIVAAVKENAGPISVGGGRFSMGGQTATQGALQLDMRQFDKVVDLSKEKKQITVQAGITWRKIQELIDPHDLSLQIMQSYSNFTVGGALSVNVHGRYIGQGPLVLSVQSIRVVLANGDVIRASPMENSEIFYGVIGGYGALGVIVEATLNLADNVKVERRTEIMPRTAYREFFVKQVRDNRDIIFHNADLYPGDFDSVRVTSYVKTDKPVTIPDRMIPKDKNYDIQHWMQWINSEWPAGKWLRRKLADPLLNRGEHVVWRNYEASYDVRELEPSSREKSTYVLQEYFVPVDKLDAFVPKLSEILDRHHVNTINVSIRYAKQDPGTLLAWAKNEVFAYVLYYKQGTSSADRQAVAAWTRELIDATNSFGGSYYLPYQIVATNQQFHTAYPNANAFFALKAKLDPTYKFRNKLWDAYYQPEGAQPISKVSLAERLKSLPNYKRDEGQTYLTVPEWLLVNIPAEYARFLTNHEPSGYPYFGSIGQFWSYYRDIYSITSKKYPFNWGYHVMVFVIGSSFTVENALKGVYEATVGRLMELLAGNELTDEDRFAAKVQQDYVNFIRVTPWYEYSFITQLKTLWRDTPILAAHPLRKLERRLALSFEYLGKAQYGMLIKLATKLAYDEEDSQMLAVSEKLPPDALKNEAKVKVIDQFADSTSLVSLPRYEEFGGVIQRLIHQGVRFREIAGNQEIFLTAIVPESWKYDFPAGEMLMSRPMLTDPNSKRVGIIVPVKSLNEVLPKLENSIEHIYDY